MNKKYSGLKHVFFFVSLFFLEWTNIKSESLEALNGMSLSLIFMIIYVFINIKRLSRFSLSKWETVAVITLAIEVILGLIISLGNGNYAGIKRFINGYLGIVIFYLGFKINYQYFSDISFRRKMIKTLYNGVLCLTLFMGGLQIAYILFRNPNIYRLINSLTYRKLVYLDAGKVQLFTEPSLFGEMLFIVYMPAAYYTLKNNIYKKNRVIYSTIAVFLINLMGISVRFFIDLLFFWASYCIAEIYVGKTSRKIQVVFISIIVAIFGVGVFYYNWFGLADSNQAIRRIHNILMSVNTVAIDGSGSARAEYIRCAWQGFIQKPFLGWGAGNYVSALKANMHVIGNAMADAELHFASMQNDMVSYSFVFTQLCENGLLGIINVVNVFYLLFRMINKHNSVIMNALSLFIMYMFIQNEMIGCFSIAMVLAFYNFNNTKKYNECEYGLIKVKIWR